MCILISCFSGGQFKPRALGFCFVFCLFLTKKIATPLKSLHGSIDIAYVMSIRYSNGGSEMILLCMDRTNEILPVRISAFLQKSLVTLSDKGRNRPNEPQDGYQIRILRVKTNMHNLNLDLSSLILE